MSFTVHTNIERKKKPGIRDELCWRVSVWGWFISTKCSLVNYFDTAVLWVREREGEGGLVVAIVYLFVDIGMAQPTETQTPTKR